MKLASRKSTSRNSSITTDSVRSSDDRSRSQAGSLYTTTANLTRHAFRSRRVSSIPEKPLSMRCLVVGDGTVGKTCLLHVYTTGIFPSRYVPTVFENYAKRIEWKGRPYMLELYDSAGQEEWDQLRVMMYPCADIFLVPTLVLYGSKKETQKWNMFLSCG
ncbi:hypothetical protein ACOME3_006996 [Neoechinorhynchus agilis]